MARRHRLPQTLTKAEQIAIISAARSQRDKLLLRLMLATGLRSAEAIGLRVDQIDLASGRMSVIGKGNYERILWIAPALAREIGKYAKQIDTALLFTTRTGRKIAGQYLRALIVRLSKKAHIEKHIHPHMLRHTFATEMYSRTRDILLVQRALGHARIGTTEIYTHVSDWELREAMRGRRSGKGERQ
jgi:site-specific recombinase XerD